MTMMMVLIRKRRKKKKTTKTTKEKKKKRKREKEERWVPPIHRFIIRAVSRPGPLDTYAPPMYGQRCYYGTVADHAEVPPNSKPSAKRGCVTVSVSTALLSVESRSLTPAGTSTVAVLTRVPDAAGSRVAVAL